MGMNVYGNAPKNDAGEYFRANIWCWHPLADYIATVAPDIASACRDWHSNEGYGLNANQSVKLADVLRDEIASGRATRYVHRRKTTASRDKEDNKHLASISAHFLEIQSTGVEIYPEPRSTLEVCVIERFAHFLENCGGFEIW
jgi:hypothetical protein